MVQECLLLIFWRSGPFRFFKNIISAISKIQNVSQKAKFYLKSVGGGFFRDTLNGTMKNNKNNTEFNKKQI